MAQTEKSGQEPGIAFDLNASVNDAIGACGGDLLATIRSLVVANNFLMEQNQMVDVPPGVLDAEAWGRRQPPADLCARVGRPLQGRPEHHRGLHRQSETEDRQTVRVDERSRQSAEAATGLVDERSETRSVKSPRANVRVRVTTVAADGTGRRHHRRVRAFVLSLHHSLEAGLVSTARRGDLRDHAQLAHGTHRSRP